MTDFDTHKQRARFSLSTSNTKTATSDSDAVKLPSLRIGLNKATESVTPPPPLETRRPPSWGDALYHYWRHSMLHATFTTCLPHAEEAEFEEKFKYLIVTSSFINESSCPSTPHHNNDTSSKKKKKRGSLQHMASVTNMDLAAAAISNTRISRGGASAGFGTVATMSGLLIALGAETVMLQQQQQQKSQEQSNHPLQILASPVLSWTMLLTGGMSIFFVYRHLRRSGIRQLYHTALSHLQVFMEHCEALDNKIQRGLTLIYDIEWVMKKRVSSSKCSNNEPNNVTPPPPCALMRNRFAALLRRAFIVYEEAIIDLRSHVNKENLAHLYGMYNVRSFATLSAVDRIEVDGSDVPSFECLEVLAQSMHAKRRECLVQFLALDIVSERHDSVRRDYANEWKGINAVLDTLVQETSKFAADAMEALEDEQYNQHHPASPNQSPLPSDNSLQPLIDRLSLMDQQARTLEAKFYLCKDDLRELAASLRTASANDEHHVRERLKQEYMSLEQDLMQMVVDWQTGRDALLGLLEPSSCDAESSSSASSPMMPTTPIIKEHPHSVLPSVAKGPSSMLDDSNNAQEFSTKTSAFRAAANVVERNTTERAPRINRAERASEMMAQRVKEAREVAAKSGHDSNAY